MIAPLIENSTAVVNVELENENGYDNRRYVCAATHDEVFDLFTETDAIDYLEIKFGGIDVTEENGMIILSPFDLSPSEHDAFLDAVRDILQDFVSESSSST